MEDTRYHCKCGMNLSYNSLSKHFRTQRHKYIMELEKKNDILVEKCLKEKNDRIKLEIVLSNLMREKKEKS
jgi:hypothetical protein